MPEAAEAGPVSAFWEFSLALYAAPGIAPWCLELQDGRGLDVNLILLCCWLGASGRGRLDEGGLRQAESAAEGWRRAVLEPLRMARRGLAGTPALYAEAKRLELAAEGEAQRRILAALAPARLSPASGDPLADAAKNLALYLGAHHASDVATRPLIEAIRSLASLSTG